MWRIIRACPPQGCPEGSQIRVASPTLDDMTDGGNRSQYPCNADASEYGSLNKLTKGGYG